MDAVDTVINRAEERLNHGCFAGTNVSGQKDKPLSLHNPVPQQVKGLSVAFTQIEKPRRRGQVKGLFF